MLLFGSITIWMAFAALLISSGFYLTAAWMRQSRGLPALSLVRFGRLGFLTAALSIVLAALTLGDLLVSHRFDAQYVYEHTARAMAPLYWFPSFWAGQEGSFLLWAFWTAVLGVVLAVTSRDAERRVMPVYSSILLFLVVLLLVRSPFVPLDTQGGPIPTEGLGLNPNLENPWMVIHPPTLFLGFSALAVPFAFALSALFWRDWDGWLRRTLPWALFGFSILGLAMMMGGYWAYEMLGWGGFWGWDPVENGPFIPWLGLIAFLHMAQIQRVRGTQMRGTLLFALLPFLMALYETFLTRTGILEKFSVHSFSTLGGVANAILLGGLALAMVVSVGVLLWRTRGLPKGESPLDAPATREFAYVAAVSALTVCALISALGMSAPLITSLGMKLHLATHVASIKEDFYNKATFPIAVLLAIGMGIGPHLAWRERGAANTSRLALCYAGAVIAAVGFIIVAHTVGSGLTGKQLLPQLILFTASVFALLSNGSLLRGLFPQRSQSARLSLPTAGSFVSHAGSAVLLIGIVCLVTFVRKDADVVLPKGNAVSVLGGQYRMTYLGQTSDYQKDKDNAVKFDVRSVHGNEHFTAYLPFAMRAVEGGPRQLFNHPAITHHAGGDLYLALVNGPTQISKTPVLHPTIAVGDHKKIGPYDVQFVNFERDRAAAAFVLQTGQMPDVFPVTALLRVTYKGVTTMVTPKYVMRRGEPGGPDGEVRLPGGWLIGFESMVAGSSKLNGATGAAMNGTFAMRADSGPPIEYFEVDVTTRPMINLVWLGTLMLVVGGFLSMRRRLGENRAVPIPDLPIPERLNSKEKTSARPRSKGRVTKNQSAPALGLGSLPAAPSRQREKSR